MLTMEPPGAAARSVEGEGQDGASPEEIAASEQEQLWAQVRSRAWHQRGWLRALGVLAVITGAAAVIPYPLRITAECAIIPTQRAKVRSELAGVIAQIAVDEGQIVKQGDVIVRLDDRALQAERRKVLAEIDKIEAELATLRKGHRPEEIQQQEAILAARRNEVAVAAFRFPCCAGVSATTPCRTPKARHSSACPRILTLASSSNQYAPFSAARSL
jgi:biotin carboxyl carrier protein